MLNMLKMIRFTLGELGPIVRSGLLNLGVGIVLGTLYVVVYFLLLSLMRGTATIGSVTICSLLLAVLIWGYYTASIHLNRFSLQAGYDSVAGLRLRLSDHLRRLPLSFFKKHDTAAISGRFLHDMADAEAVFCIYLHEIVTSLIILGLYGAMLCIADMRLGLVVVVSALSTLPFVFHAARELGREAPGYIAARSLTDKTLLEYLNGISELKAANMTGKRFTPWAEANGRFRTMALAMETRFGLRGQIFLAMLDASFVLMLLAGSWFVAGTTMTVGVFLFFLLFSGKFYQPLQDFGVFISEFRYVMASLKRIADILYEAPLPRLSGHTPPQGHAIKFNHVSFAYDDKTVLRDISFTIPEGTVTALVGESGGGKTTTLNLLLRFWDVASGTISIGGTDIRTFAQEDFYSLFSVVFQDVYLFNDTVMNNIRLARQDATDEEVMEAARMACCHDFIMALEQGYNTSVGEKGSRLSGGERQRIAIARAILKNAPILLLDEATASIDPENELLLQQGLTNLMRGKTLLVIAHRLSTIRQAHQILVLRDGKIAEHGTHSSLLENSSHYCNAWKNQEEIRSWNITNRVL